MSKNLLLIQPGAYGDIFVCAPIAKYYANQGYQVDWPATEKYKTTIAPFSYVNYIPIEYSNHHEDWLRSDVMEIMYTFDLDSYDHILNLADRLPAIVNQRSDENFEECKYRIAQVPFTEKHKLDWNRDYKKSIELYTEVAPAKPYVLVHNVDSFGNTTPFEIKTDLPVLYVREVPGYSIQDWIEIAINAESIYCVESAFHQFIDGLVTRLDCKCYLLPRVGQQPGQRYTISSYWDKTYIGNTTVRA